MMNTFPVINSTLSETGLSALLQNKYNLSSTTNCRLFRAAMNHLYIVADGEHTYVFRVYTHNWRTKAEISEELRLLNYLNESGTSVAFPIPDNLDQLIQELNAPEGKRLGVLFSYAKGIKRAKFSAEVSYHIGKELAKIHRATEGYSVERIHYDTKNLLVDSIFKVKQFFNKTTDEVLFLESLANFLTAKFKTFDKSQIRYGAVHLDVWFDNLHIDENNEVTFFDFDFCGNGWLCLDISYFLFQLLATNLDESEYRNKANSFLKGYEMEVEIKQQEKEVLPYACLAIMIYYISIQCDRFNYWTNIFVNEDHLKRMVGNLKRWINYNNIVIQEK